jgi:hypothetical protein
VLVHIVKTKPDAFIAMVTTLPIEVINEAIMHLLTNQGIIDDIFILFFLHFFIPFDYSHKIHATFWCRSRT